MTRVGCTGHQSLTPATRRAVAAAVSNLIADEDIDGLIGLTSLAEGADQVFAFAVLAAGGQLQAVIPSQRYEHSFTSASARETYSALCALAGSVTILPFPAPDEDAYLAAGRAVADQCQILVAVWDGQEAAGKGGTGDVVTYARERGIDVRVVWPEGASRS